MAFSTKVTFVPCDDKESPTTFDEVDYGLVPIATGFLEMKDNILNNFKSFNFKQVNYYYIDFVSELPIDEFLKFHEIQYRDSHYSLDFRYFMIKDIYSGRYKKVVITVYEWESGMDIFSNME